MDNIKNVSSDTTQSISANSSIPLYRYFATPIKYIDNINFWRMSNVMALNDMDEGSQINFNEMDKIELTLISIFKPETQLGEATKKKFFNNIKNLFNEEN